MEAVAHDPAFAKKVGIPQSVGKDFAAADAATTAPSHAEKVAHVIKHTATHGQLPSGGRP